MIPNGFIFQNFKNELKITRSILLGFSMCSSLVSFGCSSEVKLLKQIGISVDMTKMRSIPTKLESRFMPGSPVMHYKFEASKLVTEIIVLQIKSTKNYGRAKVVEFYKSNIPVFEINSNVSKEELESGIWFEIPIGYHYFSSYIGGGRRDANFDTNTGILSISSEDSGR